MNTQIKRQKITSIQNEVNDFHPILTSLFQAMSDFQYVDYTHGPNENGADMVLTRFDKIIGETFYIGVIAKTGKIQINFTDIERQIDECSIKRFTLNGKKNISLSEIWVINNDTVSSNAKNKISHKYSDKKIVFLDYQKVINWIDNYLPNFWFDYGMKTGEYLASINHRMEELDKEYNLLKCTNEPFYIQQDIYEIESEYSKDKRSKKRRIDIFKESVKNRVTIIEGTMGSGKSKLMRKLAKHFSSGEIFAEKKVVSVFCSYSEVIEKYNKDINKLIDDKVNRETIKEFTDENKYLILIDGVDESKLSIMKFEEP